MSHLHIAMSMNLLVHTTAGSEGVIDSAAAYATSAQQSTRFVIGDPLPLKFRVRWVEGPVLPRVGFVSGEAEGAGKVLLFCVLSALVGAAGCYAWVVGVDLPRRMKRRSAAQGGIIGNFGAGEKGRGAGYGGYSGAGVNGGGAGNGAYGYGGKRKD